MRYVIGTRGSKLALVQANYVCQRLSREYPEHEFVIQTIQTRGDRIQNVSLGEIGEKGIFVKEIEEQILSGRIDIGVHSMKDMPAVPADGLCFSSPWKREDSRDVLILREKASLEQLSPGAVIGTGSKRREFQLKKLRNDIQVVDIRGNVDTRLRKMEEQKLDGIILAAAGMHRLGMQDKITHYFEPEEIIPAPAQGVLALEVRDDAKELLFMLERFKDIETEFTAKAEREFLHAIEGNCHVPIGAFCHKIEKERYQMNVMFGDEEGKKIVYADVEGTDALAMVREAVCRIQKKQMGKVYLVGGGPGDAGLITVKGMELIRKADCIVYDRLIAPSLLQEAKPDCEKIYVGKENHHHTMRQEEIQTLLIEKARKHQIVVRLKGGDVYVFGRGGEEGLALWENKIPFEVVPGVTSATAGLAYAGIPVTHRGLAGGFHIVTAHNQRDELADIDFASMAHGNETCIFLMGLSKLGEIAERLMAAGMPKNTKAAVISCATTSRQKTCTGTLKNIGCNVKREALESPALIVVGKVVGLREKLNFFEGQERQGKKYLIPKVGEKTTKLARMLRAKGAGVDEIQVGEVIYQRNAFAKEDLINADWIIFTSRHGVKAFFWQLDEYGMDARSLGHCRIAAVGKKTGEELKKFGICADVIPSEYHSRALAEKLKPLLSVSDQVWYVKAENVESDLSEYLGQFCHFVEKKVYENRIKEFILPDQIESYDGVYFTCASSAERLMEHLHGEIPSKWMSDNCIYSIGTKCTKCLNRYGISRVLQASEASYESMEEL